MKKEFVIRIDLESQKGIRDGLPNLLRLFKKHGVKGSFYLTMGGESNVFEILGNRGKLKTTAERKIKLWSKKDKIRMVLSPIDFVKKNRQLLKKIISDGHELGLHGWKHREWTRNLDNVNLKARLKQMTSRYKEYFGKRATSWASPGFNTNKNVLRELENSGIYHISDFKEKQNFGKIKNVPINICGGNRMPFIEYWVAMGKSDEEIFEVFKKRIRGRKFVSFYLHGMFEGRFKIDLLEKMIIHLTAIKFISKKIVDIK